MNVAAAVLLVLVWLGAATSAEAARSVRYVYVSDTLGTPGSQVVDEADDGETTVRFVYKNNGRGPVLTEHFRLAPDGTFVDYRLEGTSEMGAPVDERFERRGDEATWRSTSEAGRARVVVPALYLPLSGSMAPVSVAIAALARQGEGRLPLLPSGSLEQRKVDEVQVERAGPQGPERRQVQLLLQTGLGLRPSFVWATVGPAPRLFASTDLGDEIFIEDGWQATRPLLEARQLAAERAALADMVGRLAHPLPGLTVIRNARVFDSVAGTLAAKASDVYLLRGRITAVLPSGSVARAPDNEIDAAGRVLLPGLFDMHAHVGRWDGGLHLAAGVTTVRDMGNDNPTLQRMLDEIAVGALLSPHVVPCGFLEGRSRYSSSLGFTIGTLAEAKEAVDWYAQRGYPQLKIYNSFPKEALRETVAYAHSRGMRVSGHVPAFMKAEDVVDAGFDEIQHINQVLLNFLVTPTTDTRTTERFLLPAEKLADLDFDTPQVRDFIGLLVKHRTVIDSTVATLDFIRQRDGEVSPSLAAVADHLPPDVQRQLRVGGLPIPDESTAARYRRSYAKMVDFVGHLYRAGVPLVAGTDGMQGFTLQGELALYVEAGLTPAQALQTATIAGATYSRTLADRGSVSVGKLADLVLFDGDPTHDIADVRKAALVVTQGRWFAPRELHEALAIRPFVDATPAVVRLTPDGAAAGAGHLPAAHSRAGHAH